MSRVARLFSLLIALAAGLALLAQAIHAVGSRADRDVLAEIWRMTGYFTILTNALILWHHAAIAAGRRFSAERHGGLVVAIGMVGLYAHWGFAGGQPPEGLGWWADHGLHTALPVAAALWWLALAPKAQLRLSAPLLWLAWPLLFLACAILRGHLTGFWPYGFINVDSLGLMSVAHNVMRLAVAFLGLGALVLSLGRLLSR